MNFKKTLAINHFVVLVALFGLGFVTLQGFFELGLCCDELSLLYEVKANLSNLKTVLRLFTGPYASHYMFMYFGNVLFGFNALYFFLTSLILRTFNAFSLYILVKRISNIWVGLATASWFMVGFSGLESTEGLNNSTTYIALTFINYGLLFLLNYYKKYLTKNNLRYYLKTLFFFFLAFVAGTTRVPGIIFTYFFCEFLLVLFRKTNIKSSAPRVVFFLAMIFLVRQIGFFRPEGTARSITQNPLNNISVFLGNLGVIGNNMLINLYEVTFPPSLDLTLPPQATSIAIIVFSGAIITLLFIRKEKLRAMALATSIFSFFSFLLIYYAIDPVNHIPAHSRYLLISAQALYIFYTLSFATVARHSLFAKAFLLIILAVVLTANYKSSKEFIDKRVYFRANNLMEMAYKTISEELTATKSLNRPLVLLTTDSPETNNDFIYWGILYGAKHRFMLRGTPEPLAPAFFSTEKEILNNMSATGSGVNDVYSFKVSERKLTSETYSFRNKVTEITGTK